LPLVRVRQHVNPLSDKYQQPIVPPDWEKIYAEPAQPLHLDIGCGKGYFLQNMAEQQPNWNFLGLEIREPLVEYANVRREELGLTNLYYLFCNVNHSLRSLLSSFPPQTLERVTIQFPDPWFKKRHQKRRMVQPALVEVLADHLISNGVVLIQSDIQSVAAEMRDRFSEHAAFALQGDDWLAGNPFPVMTEREQSTLSRGEPVYRALFKRK
jgi:tRNA (guanine-N7-)-methyltransferase